jgi:hypothetical protein
MASDGDRPQLDATQDVQGDGGLRTAVADAFRRHANGETPGTEPFLCVVQRIQS